MQVIDLLEDFNELHYEAPWEVGDFVEGLFSHIKVGKSPELFPGRHGIRTRDGKRSTSLLYIKQTWGPGRSIQYGSGRWRRQPIWQTLAANYTEIREWTRRFIWNNGFDNCGKPTLVCQELTDQPCRFVVRGITPRKKVLWEVMW